MSIRDHKTRLAVAYMAVGEFAFVFFIGVCVALHPGFVLRISEGGISEFGLHIKTAIPYTLALGVPGVLSWKAAMLYTEKDRMHRRLRQLLLMHSTVVLSVLCSTYFYSLSFVLKDLHFTLATMFLVLVGAGSLWMYHEGVSSAWARVFLAFQLCGEALAIASPIGPFHALFLAEMLAQIGFAALLIRACIKVSREFSPRVAH